ncbi:response regulator [Cohnella nanjingensis]|uniref:Circadian input-output histidine kinase CikA n=1 Tax=Cohnella nanjingensis TaxID=1387779 RepID=A0A7X0RP66_9BACL|nr:response regulator [Cohnella nanjingensis]MBB6671148.1 response regulator [Cohnella nanjingensis]
MFRSLRFRLWLLLLLTTGATLFLMGWFYYQSAQTTIRDSLLDNASAKVAGHSEALSVWIRARTQQVEMLAAEEAIRYGGEQARQLRLQRALHGDSLYDALSIRDLSGKLLVSDGSSAGTTERWAYPFPLATQTSVSIPFYASREHGPSNLVVAIQVPILNPFGTGESVLCATVRADAILEDSTRFGGNVLDAVSLIDRQGRLVYEPYDGRPWTHAPMDRILRAMSDDWQDHVKSDGVLYIGASIAGTGWSLVAQSATDKLYAPLHRLLLLTIAAGVAAEAALAVLLFLLISPVMNRIKAILRKTEAVAAGHFRVSPLAIDKEDEIGALAVSVNGMVVQLRRLFEPLQAVTNQNDYGIIVADASHTITQFNETAERMLGFAAAEMIGLKTPLAFSDMAELRGKAARLSARTGRRVEPGLPYFHAMLQGKLTYTEDRTYIRKDGTSLPVHLNVSKILDEQGRVTGYVSLFRDITRQKKNQEELLEAKLEAERANEAKSLFLARMSHEIRTPINGIVGFAQLLERTPLTGAQRGYLQKIVSSSEVLLGTVNHILDFSKIEAGKFELEKVSFDLDELFRKLADTLGIFIGAKPVEMIFDVQEDAPTRLMGDPLRLEQVLLNLTNNAVKFTEEGYVHLKVRVTDREPDRVALAFSVSDTGIGIREDQLAQLFRPFVQADGSTSRKYGGSGLGLVIADEMIGLMGGRLAVDSEPGVGSRFSFDLTFPIASNERKSEPCVPLHRSILCIERSGLLQEALASMLRPTWADVAFADSWTGAIETLEKLPEGQTFDYVLFNMEMPDMYGESTWLDLRSAASGAKTIAMTTPLGQNELLRMAEANRPDRSLIKPINRLALRSALAGLEEESRFEQLARLQHELRDEPPAQTRILLVEDHAINQQVACELLTERGFDVGVAADGFEALRMLAEREWDLALMDLQMPGMDGFEATRRLRERHSEWELPVVAMTANVMDDDRRKCYRVGMNDVITKPIQANALYAAVDKWTSLAKAVDWADARERVNGKDNILRQMTQTFRRDYPGFDARLVALIESGDREGAIRLLHTFRGVTGNLSARGLHEAATRLERDLARGAEDASEAAWRAGADRLSEELERVLRAMEWREKADWRASRNSE